MFLNIQRVVLWRIVQGRANSAKLTLACHIEQRGAAQLRPGPVADKQPISKAYLQL